MFRGTHNSATAVWFTHRRSPLAKSCWDNVLDGLDYTRFAAAGKGRDYLMSGGATGAGTGFLMAGTVSKYAKMAFKSSSVRFR